MGIPDMCANTTKGLRSNHSPTQLSLLQAQPIFELFIGNFFLLWGKKQTFGTIHDIITMSCLWALFLAFFGCRNMDFLPFLALKNWGIKSTTFPNFANLNDKRFIVQLKATLLPTSKTSYDRPLTPLLRHVQKDVPAATHRSMHQTDPAFPLVKGQSVRPFLLRQQCLPSDAGG